MRRVLIPVLAFLLAAFLPAQVTRLPRGCDLHELQVSVSTKAEIGKPFYVHVSVQTSIPGQVILTGAGLYSPQLLWNGCTLYVAPLLVWDMTPPPGRDDHKWEAAIPNDPVLVGARIYIQSIYDSGFFSVELGDGFEVKIESAG